MSQQESEAGPSTSPTPTTLEETLNSLDINDNTEPSTKVKSKNRKSKSKSKDPKPTPVPKVKAPKAPKPVPTPIQAFDNPAEGEEETVHGVYESIAPHFSQTRHKPWPLITTFLNSLPPHSIGLDSGAGNGKYLPTAASAGHAMIALDRSLGLLGIAKEQEGGVDVVRGDLGCRGWRDGVFDFTISVAAIHHLSTPVRRRQAVQALLPALKHNSKAPYSRFFIYVWAYEQGELSKRRMGVKATQPEGRTFENDLDDRNGKGAEGVERIEEKIQDVLVPWVLRSKPKPKSKSKSKPKTKSHPRSGSKPPSTSSPNQIENGNDNGNTTRDQIDEKNGTGPQKEEAEEEAQDGEKEEEEKVFNRYYHLFVEGELRDLIYKAGEEEGYRILPPISSSSSTSTSPLASSTSTASTSTENSQDQRRDGGKWLRIRGEGWEADNWWVEAEVGVGEGQ